MDGPVMIAYRASKSQAPKGCAEVLAEGQTTSGVFKIDPLGTGAIDVYCDLQTFGGGWTFVGRNGATAARITRQFPMVIRAASASDERSFPQRPQSSNDRAQ